jgi:hypothetical protein
MSRAFQAGHYTLTPSPTLFKLHRVKGTTRVVLHCCIACSAKMNINLQDKLITSSLIPGTILQQVCFFSIKLHQHLSNNLRRTMQATHRASITLNPMKLDEGI